MHSSRCRNGTEVADLDLSKQVTPMSNARIVVVSSQRCTRLIEEDCTASCLVRSNAAIQGSRRYRLNTKYPRLCCMRRDLGSNTCFITLSKPPVHAFRKICLVRSLLIPTCPPLPNKQRHHPNKTSKIPIFNATAQCNIKVHPLYNFFPSPSSTTAHSKSPP